MKLWPGAFSFHKFHKSTRHIPIQIILLHTNISEIDTKNVVVLKNGLLLIIN